MEREREKKGKRGDGWMDGWMERFGCHDYSTGSSGVMIREWIWIVTMRLTRGYSANQNDSSSRASMPSNLFYAVVATVKGMEPIMWYSVTRA